MKTSETINELATALAMAQAKMTNAIKNAENPAFKAGGKVSKYANLAAVREASLTCLNEQGIALLQATEVNEHGLLLNTRLVHKSGQWIEGSYPLPVSANIQQAASAMSYVRRYGWSAICALATEEDDDGNAATVPKTNGGSATGELISPAQLKTLRNAINEVEADEAMFVRYLKVASLDALPADQYDRAMLALNAKKKVKAA